MEENKGGTLIYKCRKCGGYVHSIHVPDALIALSCIITGAEYPWKGSQSTMTMLHVCDKESLGVADLIGVQYDDPRLV